MVERGQRRSGADVIPTRQWIPAPQCDAPGDLAVLPELEALEAAWQAGLTSGQAALQDPGRLACVYVARGALRLAGKRWLQGRRRPALPWTRDLPEVRLLAERQVFRVEAQVAAGLVHWAHGRRKLLALFEIPQARQVLAWQAQGMRCVSLLPDGSETGLQASTLEFALHDLCHAEKFFDPAHHVGQVGWSAMLDAALDRPEWQTMIRGFDETWPAELDHAAADMNGSPLFLFSALRRKVELATMRAGRERMQAREALLDALHMHGPARTAGATFTVHSDVDPAVIKHNAELLLAWFEAAGLRALERS